MGIMWATLIMPHESMVTCSTGQYCHDLRRLMITGEGSTIDLGHAHHPTSTAASVLSQ